MNRRERRYRAAVVRIGVALAWVAIAGLFLLWEAAHYTGILSVMGEWEFNAFGRYYPSFNFMLTLLVLSIPAMLILLLRRRRTRYEHESEIGVVRSAALFSQAMLAFGGGLMIVALGVLMAILFLPGAGGPAQEVTVGRLGSDLPHEGLTRLNGTALYPRTAGFDQDLILTHRSSRFTPIIGNGENDGTLQFFIAVDAADPPSLADEAPLVGVLKQGGLPGEILRLFRYAGYHVEEPYFVLFKDARVMRWPYWIISGQLLVAALLIIAAGLWQRRKAQALRKEIQATKELPAS